MCYTHAAHAHQESSQVRSNRTLLLKHPWGCLTGAQRRAAQQPGILWRKSCVLRSGTPCSSSPCSDCNHYGDSVNKQHRIRCVHHRLCSRVCVAGENKQCSRVQVCWLPRLPCRVRALRYKMQHTLHAVLLGTDACDVRGHLCAWL